MRYFFGCLLAAAAGLCIVHVPHAIFYANPEWMLVDYLGHDIDT